MPTATRDTKADFLLDKGINILWSKGYNGTSVNDIVKAAEVPKGSFYFYFDSKEDFAVKALERYFKMQAEPALAILNDEKLSPKERLIKFFEYRVSILKKDLKCTMGCMASNLANEMSEHSEMIRKTILRKHSTIKGHMTETVRAAQEAGEININLDPENLVNFIEDAARGAMVSMKEMKSSQPIDNALNIIKAVLLK